MADIMDLMNAFIDSGESTIDEEMFELEQEYSAKFGHGVPREMLPPSVNETQIKEAVETCIKTNQDQLFDLLGVSIDDGSLY